MDDNHNWIDTFEKQVTSVDILSYFLIDKAVAVGMGVKHMNDMDTVTVELETDIILPIIFAHCPNLRAVTVNDVS